MKYLLFVLSFFAVSFLAGPVAIGAEIVALCIGNEAYTRVDDQLDTPVNDALLMKHTLQNLPGGAEVIFVENGTKAEIQRALLKFKAAASSAKLAVVYYSGHGTEDIPTGYDKAETFLLPVDVVIHDVDDLPINAIPLNDILNALKTSHATARAVFLDCCRSGAPRATQALAKATKNFGDIDERVKMALGSAVVPEGTLIAFAASPGRKAAAFLTETDENSPFTYFLSEQMNKSGANLFSIVLEAGKITKVRTGGRQVPYINYAGDAGIITEVVLRPGAPELSATAPAKLAAPPPMAATGLASPPTAGGTLVFNLAPKNATVYVNGKRTQVEPRFELELGEGQYQLQAKAPGYDDQNVAVSVPGMGRLPVSLELKRSTGHLRVNTDPKGIDCTIELLRSELLDEETEAGKPQTKMAPAKFGGLPTGVYKITARRPGHQQVVRHATIIAGQEETVALEFGPDTVLK